MKARKDGQDVPVTQRFVDALKELMQAECEMEATRNPESAALWAEGRCYIDDLANSDGIRRSYGPRGEFGDGRGEFAVVSVRPETVAHLRGGASKEGGR